MLSPKAVVLAVILFWNATSSAFHPGYESFQMTDKLLEMFVWIKCNGHLWSQRFTGVSHHLFVFVTCLYCTHRLGPMRLWLKICEPNEWPNCPTFAYTQRATMCNIWPGRFLNISRQKNGARWLFHLHYGQWHNYARKVPCGEWFTDRLSSLKFSHTYDGMWPP